MIHTKTALKICSNWHGGMNSALYYFVSTRKYNIEFHLKYLQEIYSNLENNFFATYPRILSNKENKELNDLKDYFVEIASKYLIFTEFTKEPIYGYTIPIVNKKSDKKFIDKIKPIKFIL